MKEKKNSVFSSGLIWFGAAVSIAEIMTGTMIASLGFKKGIAAILLGHAIGCALLFSAGLIGGKTQKSAMETVKMSFGQQGSLLFSFLNVLQLIGWTAVMIFSGAVAANSVVPMVGPGLWSLIIGLLIIVWILIGVTNLGKVHFVAMSALFVLTMILSMVIFRQAGALVFQQAISFGAAVELSVAMPLSWLPLISDYTRLAKKPVSATTAGVAAYFFTSSWMYIIGMGATILTGETDIAAIMMKAGLGTVALIIIVFSTVTTTFLDSYSAGVSSVSISKKLKEKPAAVVVCSVGILLAMFASINRFEEFLYLIGSVFAPMIAIQIVDFYILRKDSSGKRANWVNLLLWLIGFILYRYFMFIETPMGNTAPVMLITALLSIITAKISGGKKDAERNA